VLQSPQVPFSVPSHSLEPSNGYEVKDKKSSGPKGSRTPDPRHVKAHENNNESDLASSIPDDNNNNSSPPSENIRAENFMPTESIGGYGVDREFKSCPPPSCSIYQTIDWQQFHNFLLQRVTAKTAEDRIQYASDMLTYWQIRETLVTSYCLLLQKSAFIS
jgi:hypothetical protein